eukprot:286151-Rhodomonas_salina.2
MMTAHVWQVSLFQEDGNALFKALKEGPVQSFMDSLHAACLIPRPPLFFFFFFFFLSFPVCLFKALKEALGCSADGTVMP